VLADTVSERSYLTLKLLLYILGCFQDLYQGCEGERRSNLRPCLTLTPHLKILNRIKLEAIGRANIPQIRLIDLEKPCFKQTDTENSSDMSQGQKKNNNLFYRS